MNQVLLGAGSSTCMLQARRKRARWLGPNAAARGLGDGPTKEGERITEEAEEDRMGPACEGAKKRTGRL